MEVASEACVKWCHDGTDTSSDAVSDDKTIAEQTIVFGLLEKDLAENFSKMIKEKSKEVQ